MSSPEKAKRQRTDQTAKDIGPDQLRNWVADPSSRFSPAARASLISSPNIHASDILQFVLEFVFGWSLVKFIDQDADFYWDNLDHIGRIKALSFVKQWLGQEPELSALPSLARLCAQRIAMEIFPTFMEDIDRYFEYKDLSYFQGHERSLKKSIASQLTDIEVPEHLHEAVAEEIFIFTIVYFLFIDLRTMVDEPSGASQLQLPVEKKKRDDWWDNYGKCGIVWCVPNFGRGSLAKAGLLPYSVYASCRNNLAMGNTIGGYGHVGVVSLLFYEKELKIKHPFAYSVAFAPIAFVVFDFFLSNKYDGEIIEQNLIPWLMQRWDLKRETSHHSYDCLITATTAMTEPLDELFGLPPMGMDYDTNYAIGQDLFVEYDAFELYRSITLDPSSRSENEYVKRLRLNGNFSKAEMLHAAILSQRAHLVDLEYCWNLDEECLERIMGQLERVTVVLLKGTSISEDSELIKKLRKERGVKFVFSDMQMLRNNLYQRVRSQGQTNEIKLN